MAKKILVVDDSKTALLMEREILEKRSRYQCVTACRRPGSRREGAAGTPRLGFDGCGDAPRMNGFEACKIMRQHPNTREIPIVLVTTRGEEAYLEAGFQSGCNDYITKPG